MKKPILLIVFSILFALGPIIILLIGMTIAEINSCVVHEGYANSCIVLGIEMGDMLYATAVIPWFSFFTIPVGAVFFIIGLVWLIIKSARSVQNENPS